MEDQVQDRGNDGGEHLIRVKRVRKRRRSSTKKNRPWYKSKRLRHGLGILGYTFLAVLLIAVAAAIVYTLTTVEN